ncbi:hypothetical protein A8924_2049 [Saccharopolyspora erythraea NRRL 2338]|uniref:Uncharacterized protein n=2 Tax=Saccharopolyspora erythraea TaxID=1836 RepID=A4FA89_SACEN|nr:hypothetical protein [Saccharopolyspora erythraea]EQD81340.1 hypothetical protein N599_36775 [Saccharopolyspora erythraea D]PFG94750.1 hypothetical protein A8924_2049 [Saccharopolyspora erythraea NRRL 2338]QRK91472.1 hypothetical protein JQX30_08805 [Saccharopolyspora erythraea]QUH01200.1 hypothetical protein HUO13_10595 [Saccharopolyspora erythraea]CAM00964.1 hypothetical protein SACE_1645 [Saccharopolyspora erythraea NRRL 2338]
MTDAQNLPAAGPTTVSQDMLAATLAALMPLGGGFLILWGYAWLDIFGAIVGAALAGGWAFWWRNKHRTFFPKDLRGGSVGGVAVLVALFGLFFFLAL